MIDGGRELLNVVYLVKEEPREREMMKREKCIRFSCPGRKRNKKFGVLVKYL